MRLRVAEILLQGLQTLFEGVKLGLLAVGLVGADAQRPGECQQDEELFEVHPGELTRTGRAYSNCTRASPVISGGQPAPHPIQGIGAGFIPRNLHTDLLDGVIKVDAAAAKNMARRAATEEGMLVGISSGATLAAIAQKLAELPPGSRVLGFNYDTGERYLSVPDFLPEI